MLTSNASQSIELITTIIISLFTFEISYRELRDSGNGKDQPMTLQRNLRVVH